MKKIIFAFAGLAFIPVLTMAQSSQFEGLNLGLGLGVIQPKVRYTDSESGRSDWKKTSLVPQMDISYHKALNEKWLLGVGLTGDLAKTSAGTENQDYGSVKTSLKKHYSAYIQSTYALDNSLAAFAKIGYHSAQVNAIGQSGANWIDDIFRTQGISYGAGVKKALNNNFYVQAELQYVDYRNKNFHDLYGYEWHYKQRTVGAIITLGYKF